MSRHNVKIETLSSVHVGSGEKKVRGIDFLDDENRVYFLNIDKIGNTLGVVANPKIAIEWSDMTMRGRQKEFFRKKGVDYKKLSRSVFNYVEEFSDKAPSISMQMRDGRGIAYIPGSSIKGAIRTAIFAQLSKDEIGNAYKKAKIMASKEPNKTKAKRIEGDCLSSWAKEFFGETSNDTFRFLRVGDAFFEKAKMGVINTVQIKKDKNNPRAAAIDTIKQYAEVLLSNNNTCFALTLDDKGLTKAIENKIVSRNIPQFKNVETLFSTINTHTRHLVKSEIEKWDNVIDADTMCDFLSGILDQIDECSPKECILRMGNASGKRFITGGILERFNFDRNAVPKTRRIEIVEDGGEEFYDLLGFVKLTLIDD